MLNFVKILVTLIWIVGSSNAAFSHSKVNTTSPGNGAVLEDVPASVDLNFAGKIRLTKVTIQREDKDPIDFDLSGIKGFQNKFSLPNESKDSGHYKIEWRGLGTNGHILKGTFSFTVK